MKSQEIISLLEDWNLWHRELDSGIDRDFYIEKLKSLTEDSHIIVITGPRRAGKTFIMRQFAKFLIKQGIPSNCILMINFEDPRFTELNPQMLEKIYNTYLEYLSPKSKVYLFLDEIQAVQNWEKWVLKMHELKKAQIFISGSNAKLLSRELSTLLTGRHLDLTVMPLSFKEFLKFKNSQEANKILLKNFLNEYIEFGGFPEVVLRKNKREILLTYINDIIEKDVIKRYRIRKAEEIKALVRFYLTNFSSPVTNTSVSKFLNISKDTVEKFSSYLEDAFILSFLKRFSFKIKEVEKSARKVYSIDTGLSNTIGFSFTENIGRNAENIVYLELLRMKSEQKQLEIFYWKDIQNREVDFVIKKGRAVEKLIQVCWDIKNPKTLQREIRAIMSASEKLNCNQLFIINADIEDSVNINGKALKIVQLTNFLQNRIEF